jgi:hypothetical protein
MKSVARTRRRVKRDKPSEGQVSETRRKMRLRDLRRILRDRNGATLPDDDAGREYLIELLRPISIGPHADIKMRNAIEVWAPWMAEDEAQELIDDIRLSPRWERTPTGKTLGERLNLTYAQRAKLDIRTIRACDISEVGMALIRKQKNRRRKQRARRLQGAKPRAEYLATSISQTKPWIAAGFNTRRTWERKGKPLVASPSAMKLAIAEDIPATGMAEATSSSFSSASFGVRLADGHLSAGLSQTYVTSAYGAVIATSPPSGGFLLGAFIPVSEADYLGWTPELAAWLAEATKPQSIGDLLVAA